MAIALTDLGFDTGLDMQEVAKVAEYFNTIRDHYREVGILNPKVKDTEPKH